MANADTTELAGLSDPGRRRLTWAALALVVVFGTVVRLIGIGFLLPQTTAPDGQILECDVRLLRGDHPDFEHEYGNGLYPQLLSWVAARVIPSDEGVAAGDALRDHLRKAAAPRRAIRIVLALLSMLIVPATWLIARRFLAPGWSLAAAALMSASFLHVWFAQQERPHGAAAAFAAWAIIAALNLRRSPDIPAYLLVGIAMGLAVASLQSGFAVLPAVVTAFALRDRSARRAPAIWGLVSLCILALFTWVFYPFVFDATQAPPLHELGLDGTELNLSGHRLDLRQFNGAGFATVLETIWTYEPLIGALALGGVIFWLARRMRARIASAGHPPIDRDGHGRGGGRDRRDDLYIVLAYVVPYLFAIGMFEETFQRFVIPLLPYIACLSAYGLAAIASTFSAWRIPALARRALIIALLAVALGAQGIAVGKLVSIRAAPDTITQAARWIENHSRPGEDRILVQPALDLPLFQTETARTANERMLHKRYFPWTWYQWNVPAALRPKAEFDLITIGQGRDELANALTTDPAGYLGALHGDYAVIEVYEGWGWLPLRRLRAELRTMGERVARFAPDREDRWNDMPLLFQDDHLRPRISWVWRTLNARCTGPTVEIYRLPR